MNPASLSINWPTSGRYLVAVSGGADSMTLLHLLAIAAPDRGYQLVVAHVDHGLRPDSAVDRQLVQDAAATLGLPFDYHEARLPAGASEATARAARHTWLQSAARRHNAAAIITAHHQDDLLETSLLNLARGTGRRGLAPMQTGPILRPLLAVTRQSLRAYAAQHHITWRDDPTNTDLTNPRNHLRHQVLPHATPAWRQAYLDHLNRLATLNARIDQRLAQLLEECSIRSSEDQLPTASFAFPRPLVRELSLPELEELLVAAARTLAPNFEPNRRLIQELALFAKTAPSHRRRPLRPDLQITVQPRSIRVYYMGISGINFGNNNR